MACLYLCKNGMCDLWEEDNIECQPSGCDARGYCLEVDKDVEDITCDCFEDEENYTYDELDDEDYEDYDEDYDEDYEDEEEE